MEKDSLNADNKGAQVMMLAQRVTSFKKASEAFHASSESVSSNPNISKKGQEVCRDYFDKESDLLSVGLALDGKEARLTDLERLLFRWAVWRKAATYTATLTLNYLEKANKFVGQIYRGEVKFREGTQDGNHISIPLQRAETDYEDRDAVIIMSMLDRAEKELFAAVERGDAYGIKW